MSIVAPTVKIRKSDKNSNTTIYLLESESDVRKKIMAATTDSQKAIVYDSSRPGVSNLLEIYTNTSGKHLQAAQSEFRGKGYKEFKEAVAEAVVAFLRPFQERYKNFRESGELLKILATGAKRATTISTKKLSEVYNKVGFVTN